MDKTNRRLEEENIELRKRNEYLEKKIKKLDSRLNSIIKINDRNFRSVVDKNDSLEKLIYRFNRILRQSDNQGKSILLQKEEQEQVSLIHSRMALMGEMIDNIAHQWQQPLNVISLMVQNLILKYYSDKLDEDKINSFDKDISQQIKFMSNTINDFRNFLKEDKKFKYFDLKDTLKKIESLTKDICMVNGIELIVNIPESPIGIYGIENELMQVFMNFITNSNDAFQNDQEKKIVIIDIEAREFEVLISFKDNAGGIGKTHLKKVFKAKFTTKEDKGGSGIGLYMSRKIVKDTFKGDITVQNETFIFEEESFKGALFSLIIPDISKALMLDPESRIAGN